MRGGNRCAVSQRAFGNIFWLEIFWQAVVSFHNCAIQIHQPVARKHALRRNMTNFRTQYFEDNGLFFTIRRKINVTAFARQAYPTLIDMDQMRNPKPRSGTVNRNRLTFDRFCATKLNQMLFFSIGIAIDTAVKSLIISRWLKPRFFFISAIENARYGWSSPPSHR